MTPRRTTNSTPQNIPTNYLHSLRECVQRLQDSSVKLQSSLNKLELSNFSRIKKLICCKRVYELVTEAEICEAQSSLAVQLEPRVKNLLSKAEDMLRELEKKEDMLQEEADQREHELDMELKKSQLDSTFPLLLAEHCRESLPNSKNGNAKSSMKVKKLKEVKKKVERMAKIVAKLEEEYNQKETELQLQKQRVATEKRPSAIKTPKKSTRKKSLSASALAAVEEQIRDIDILIGEKREILDEQQSLSLEVLQAMETPPYESNFEIQKAISSLQENIYKGVENMKILSKLFYPTANVGVTIATLVENLLQAEKNEKYIKELRKEFPPEQERLHRLQTAITLLNRLEITETILLDEDQPILKFKFVI
ncbi:dash complex subunit spc19 [Gigaspora margarita]|uniref:DASH complex subunit SPC19 n=1 Tax=Gigaspora margarita TaxID=4874 RepID=A0A8H4B195_GIGMA|nr:dash complex subunit spc19 [Gigaspora margarita]